MRTTPCRTLAALLLLGLFGIRPLAAQSPMASSPVAGIVARLGSQRRSVEFAGPTEIPRPPLQGTAEVFSVGGEVSIPVLFDGRLGVVGRLVYTQASERLSFESPGYGLWDESSETWFVSSSDRLEFTTESAQLELLADLRIGGRLHLRCGPSVGYRFSSSSRLPSDAVLSMEGDLIKTFINYGAVGVVIGPEGVTLIVNNEGKNGAVTLPRDGLRFSPASLQMGGVAGLSFDFPIGGSFVLAPEVTLQGSIAPELTGTDEAAYRIGAGLSLRRSFNRSGREIPALPSPEPERDARSESFVETALSIIPLTAAISVNGVGPDESILPYAEIGIYETLRRRDSSVSWEIEKEIVQPVLLIDPQYSEAAERWRIRFRYGDTVIAEASSDDEAALARVNWSIASEADSTHPLAVELTVADSSGASLTAVDHIPIRIRRVCRIAEEYDDRTLHTLYPFAADSDIIAPQNEAVLNEIVATTGNGARLMVTGFAGDAEERRGGDDLNDKRVEQVVRILRRALEEQGKEDVDVEIASLGTSVEPYREGLPHGRSLRPHVEIVVRR